MAKPRRTVILNRKARRVIHEFDSIKECMGFIDYNGRLSAHTLRELRGNKIMNVGGNFIALGYVDVSELKFSIGVRQIFERREKEIKLKWKRRGKRIMIFDADLNLIDIWDKSMVSLAEREGMKANTMKARLSKTPQFILNCCIDKGERRRTSALYSDRVYLYWRDFFVIKPMTDKFYKK